MSIFTMQASSSNNINKYYKFLAGKAVRPVDYRPAILKMNFPDCQVNDS
jgi:hypothetical protein